MLVKGSVWLLIAVIYEIRKLSMNYRNDLDECIAYLKLPSEYAQFYSIVFWVASLTFALQLNIRQKVPKTPRELWYCILHEHYKTTIFLHKMSIFGKNITIPKTHFIGAIPVDIIPFKKLKKFMYSCLRAHSLIENKQVFMYSLYIFPLLMYETKVKGKCLILKMKLLIRNHIRMVMFPTN